MPLSDRPNVKLEQADGRVVAHLVNCPALNDLATPTVSPQLQDVADEVGAGVLILDFSGVIYASSAALALCLKLHHKLRGAGGKLTLRGLSPDVYETFDVTGLTRVLEIERPPVAG